MSEAKSLAVVGEQKAPGLALSGSVQIHGMRDVFALAERLAQARGFVPDAYAGKPEALAAVILTGVELGLGPMQAMREIHVIKGKPSISANLMLALARRSGVKTRWIKTDATIATIGVTVPGVAEQQMSFTAEQAKAAGLWGQGNWKSYPDAMLRARCISSAIRAFCPEVIGGSSVYESESGEVSDGVPAAQVIEAQVMPPTPQQPTEPAAPPRLASLTTPEALRDWCAHHGAYALGQRGGRERVMQRAAQLEVPAHVVAAWLDGTAEAPSYDPSEQDAPPPDET